MNNISKSFHDIEQQFLQSNAQVLSLDCFDTLFWRRVATPFDIFTKIGNGISPLLRAKVEKKARQRKKSRSKIDEVTIEEIYAELSSDFSDQEIQALIEHEIALEAEHGFLFSPAVELLRKAKKKGIRTIIVSDIYYSATQLSKILSSQSPEILTLVDHIYCSADFGCAKYNTLWEKIIASECINPKDIFHIGDNQFSDYYKAKESKIDAHHFLQNTPIINNVLKQRTIAASIIFPSFRNTEPLPSYFHQCYSTGLRSDINGETLIGWTVLGPIMYLFAQFIKQTSKKIPKVKLGFLMRDGHMPQQAYQALYPEEHTASLNISRLSSIRSSFYNRESIEKHLNNILGDVDHDAIINQQGLDMLFNHLMLNSKYIKKIKNSIAKKQYTVKNISKALLTDEIIQKVINNSTEFRKRLISHLRKETNIAPGDTLMFVDIGYQGTTQNTLTHLLEKELNITVTGCYLIAAYSPGWQKNRYGMVNPDTLDYRLNSALIRYIASFEMICSSHVASTIDYTASGEPIGDSDWKSVDWMKAVKNIQHSALDFIRSTSHIEHPLTQSLWDSALIELVRYIYFPLRQEAQVLGTMNFDYNYGSNIKAELVSIDKSINYMRKYGMSRLTIGEEESVNHPVDLRYCSIEQSISLLTSKRYGLSWPIGSCIQRTQQLDVMFVTQQNSVLKTLTANYTFDGFYSLHIPVTVEEIVLMAGKKLCDLEIYCINLVEEKDLYSKHGQYNSYDMLLNRDYFIDGGSVVNKLITNLSDDGFIYFRLPKIEEKSVIQIIYRPLSEK